MRLVHFSDIHLSKDNYKEYQNYFKDALLDDLSFYHTTENPIDLILITGDLVDRGGHSLFEIDGYRDYDSPYDIFEELFIEPINKSLRIPKTNFLFIPGNHDIDESEILWVDEKKMKTEFTAKNINEQLQSNQHNFNHTNDRIKKFKEFERKFHHSNTTYECTNNQSTFSYKSNGEHNIGFILVNDSWRCSTCNLEDKNYNKHLFGVQQLNDGIKNLEKYNPALNICLIHHPIINYDEKEEVKRFLKTQDVDLLLFGHSHKSSSEKYYSPVGGCLGFKGRATLNRPEETHVKYIPGYQIFEISLESNKIQRIIYRRYSYDNCQFVADVDYAPKGGIDDNQELGGTGYPFSRKVSTTTKLDGLKLNDFRRPSE